MSLRPWREIAKPHKDVLHGTFKQSEFAADISQVASGKASPEYCDPEAFFSRTFITEGMRLLLISVAQRLAGKGGDPVIQLQTAFGGGKTHTMLAVLHLAKRQVGTDKLEGIPPILDASGIEELQKANVAVIDGIQLSPSQIMWHGALTVNTIWGELAFQLLGEEGFAMVADADENGTSPGKEALIALLRKAAPCVILMDELVAFFRQLEMGEQYNAGTFDSNLSFIQALTEALKAVPDAMLLASLPESDLEIGGTMGQRALDSLEKYFGRVEAVWKPVAAEEAFEIVRRRLFESAGDAAQIEEVCRNFFEFYRKQNTKFPAETLNNHYFERLCQSYPIHPEIFDRLYEDWSTLDKFQHTRGVLQYMAIVIHHLWNTDNNDALIMPGSIVLSDSEVRNKSIHYLPQGWEPVLEAEVDGPRSIPTEIDGHDTRFGSIQAARRSARTIFLGSAPAAKKQEVKGLKLERVLLGCAQPGQTLGVFVDVLKRLRDRLHYLYSDQDQFWFDTNPNLRREMESRKKDMDEQTQLLPLLKEQVRRAIRPGTHLTGIHVFTPSEDIPDDYGLGPRLVVLPPNVGYSRRDTHLVCNAAEKILRRRGEQPRQKQNRLIFFAADFDAVSRLKDQGRTFLAWSSITDDVQDGKMDHLSVASVNEAQRSCDNAEQALKQMVRETYKWLVCPLEEFKNGKPLLKWEAVSVSPAATNLTYEIETKLREEEWLISEWSPIHLRSILQQWYFKENVKDVSALKVFQDCAHYLYLPRLVNDRVYKDSIAKGIESEDYFGFAAGKDGERYLGFAFGARSSILLDEAVLLIERETAAAYKEETKPVPLPEPSPATTPTPDPVPTLTPDPTPPGKKLKRFYGTLDLDPIQAKLAFAQIVDEVVQHFTSKPGTEVSISVEIQAESGDGFDDNLRRTVKENCDVLRFRNAEFEEGE